MFFARFVGDARSRESHRLGKWRVRPAEPARQRGNESAYRRLNARLPHPSVKRVCVSYLQNWQARQSGRPRRASPGGPGSLAAPGPGPHLKCGAGKMLAPSESRRRSWQPRPLRHILPAAALVIGATVLGAVILYGVTGWLWLVAHQGLH
jgi:hypothetical protein